MTSWLGSSRRFIRRRLAGNKIGSTTYVEFLRPLSVLPDREGAQELDVSIIMLGFQIPHQRHRIIMRLFMRAVEQRHLAVA